MACAVIAHGTDHPAVSYSRRQAWYPGRFDSVPLTHRTVVSSVDEAVAAGYLDGLKAKPGAHRTTKRQSTFWATPLLLDALSAVRLEYEPGSAIRLRDANGDPVSFRETERVARLRRDMAGINEAMAHVDVGIDPAASSLDWDVGQHRIRARRVRDGRETWATVTPTPCNDVYRVFGRGRFDKGGRLYGWWQSLPKDRRRELLLNGEISVEPDYAFLHPTLLYAMRGAVLIGDPYETGQFPRAHGKFALNVALNARSLPLAVNAMMHRNRETPGSWPHSRRYTERLVDAVVARNAPIAADIGADRGIDCMAIDSGMAVQVLKRCAKASIPCLPVHDSFRVRARDEGHVTAIMGEVLDATRVAISPKVTMVSAVSFPHMHPSSRGVSSAEPLVPLVAEPVVTSPAEPGTLPGTVEGVSLPEAGVRYRAFLRVSPPRPVASCRPRVVPAPEAVALSLPVGFAPAPVVSRVPVAPSSSGPGLPAFLRACLEPLAPERTPGPSPEPTVPSRPLSGLAALRRALAPAEVATDAFMVRRVPVLTSPSPEPVTSPVPMPDALLAVPESIPPQVAPVSVQRPSIPMTKAERVARLRGIAASLRADRTPEQREAHAEFMRAVKGQAALERHRAITR